MRRIIVLASVALVSASLVQLSGCVYEDRGHEGYYRDRDWDHDRGRAYEEREHDEHEEWRR